MAGPEPTRSEDEAKKPQSDPPVILLFRDVQQALAASGLSFGTLVGGQGDKIDFLIAVGDRRIAIETLDFSEAKLRPRLKDILLPRCKRIGAGELWIVTRDTVEESVRPQFRNEPVHFLTLPQFNSLIEKMKILGTTLSKPS